MRPEYPSVILLAVPAFITLSIVEVVVMKYIDDEHAFGTKDTAASLAMGMGNLLVGFLPAGLAAYLMVQAFEHRLLELGYGWWVVGLCVITYDLLYYWKHRWMHEVRWFWANHVVHHSSQHYNLSTALRQPWTGRVTGMAFLSIPLAYIGFDPRMLAFAGGIDLVYQFWIHTEAIKKMPRWFEYIFNTPSHHRVHHGANARYLDANYAGIFIVWDRMFGTFVPELEEEKVKYGLLHNVDTYNPLRIGFHEYVAIARDVFKPGLTLSQRFWYVFGRPGWSHDGSRQTVPELKRELAERDPSLAGSPGFPSSCPHPKGAPMKDEISSQSA